MSSLTKIIFFIYLYKLNRYPVFHLFKSLRADVFDILDFLN